MKQKIIAEQEKIRMIAEEAQAIEEQRRQLQKEEE